MPATATENTAGRPFVRTIAVIAALMAWAVPAVAQYGDDTVEDDHPARVSLVGFLDAFTPGETQLIGVRFELDPKWHIYWDGQNETGLAPTVDLTLPEGFTAGAILWPGPTRYVSPGDILDHVYEDEVTLLIPITLDESVAPTPSVTIAASIEWLVCSDVCIPGWGESSLTMAVTAPGETPAPGTGFRAITAARAALPIDLTGDQTGDQSGNAAETQKDFTATWSEGVLTIAPRGRVRTLAFYPGPGSVMVADLLATGASTGAALRLTPDLSVGPVQGTTPVAESASNTAPRGPAIRGVLEIVRPGSARPIRYTVRFPLPASASKVGVGP